MPTIYCVEDDNGIRELISCALRSGGYGVKAFPMAKPFYEELETSLPSLILLDIMLPNEDGLSVLSKLKADPKYKDIPVIMLTAKSTKFRDWSLARTTTSQSLSALWKCSRA